MTEAESSQWGCGKAQSPIRSIARKTLAEALPFPGGHPTTFGGNGRLLSATSIQGCKGKDVWSPWPFSKKQSRCNCMLLKTPLLQQRESVIKVINPLGRLPSPHTSTHPHDTWKPQLRARVEPTLTKGTWEGGRLRNLRGPSRCSPRRKDLRRRQCGGRGGWQRRGPVKRHPLHRTADLC